MKRSVNILDGKHYWPAMQIRWKSSACFQWWSDILQVWFQVERGCWGSIPGWSYLKGNNFYLLFTHFSKTYPEIVVTATFKSSKKGKGFWFALPAISKLLQVVWFWLCDFPIHENSQPKCCGRELTLLTRKPYLLVQLNGRNQETLSARAQITRKDVMSDLLAPFMCCLIL